MSDGCPTLGRMRKLSALFFVASFSASGCATIFNGQTQIVHVETVPEGCRVSLDGQSSQPSPCSFPVKRGQEHTLRIEKDGYRSNTMTLSKSFSPVTLLNCLLPGFLIWYAVDFVDGAAWQLDRETVSVTLDPAAVAMPAPVASATP